MSRTAFRIRRLFQNFRPVDYVVTFGIPAAIAVVIIAFL